MRKKIPDVDRKIKLHPKLRMFCNGSLEVNILRAELAGALALKDPKLCAMQPTLRNQTNVPLAPGARIKRSKTKSIKSVTDSVFVNVFIELEDDHSNQDILPGETARLGNLVTAQVALDQLDNLILNNKSIRFISPGEPLSLPNPISSVEITMPTRSTRKVEESRLHRGGKGVLVGIIDVQGFAFDHPDFLDTNGNTTRFYRIWDQGGTARPSPNINSGSPFNYGAEFTNAMLNTAIQDAPTAGIPATEIERQSQQVSGSHATHVASIAAGNLGICPKAVIAGVLIQLEEGDHDRRLSFYDSSRIAHAVSYLFDLGKDLDLPVSINISLGTNGHAHDASSAASRWIDSALSVPGRSICIAAGNAGQEAPTQPGDIGFTMGRIHTSGRILATGLEKDIHWRVVGNTIADISENELEIWYSSQDLIGVSIKPPGGEWINAVRPGQFIENKQLDNLTFVSVYNELYHPANGDNYIAIYLSPLLEQSGVVGVPAGEWTIRFHGIDIRDGNYHAWIERDDPGRMGASGGREFWRFPSFFSSTSNVDDSSISSLACGQRVVSVANLNEQNNQPHISSSQGPTRDGREKPEVTAPGTDIPAANGFGLEEEPWVSMTGTSMASPYVAGVAGLMLSTESRLTAAQILGIIKRTAKPLPGDDFRWRNDTGFGVIDAEACVREAALVYDMREDVTS